MAEKLPPEVQQQIVKLQQLQAQLNQVVTEKALLQQELRDISRA
ncbi:MAG TPA: prefoldin subunit beta, partial [Ignisphaera sp.]|nr:prefoldin subunit beta [Ignisphaera sp.]